MSNDDKSKIVYSVKPEVTDFEVSQPEVELPIEKNDINIEDSSRESIVLDSGGSNTTTDSMNLGNDSYQSNGGSTSGESTGVDRKPADAIGSQGYNPNGGQASGGSFSSPSNSGLPNRDGLNKNDTPGNSMPNNGETAPDVGKDYGRPQEPGPNSNGYNPYSQEANQGNGDNQVDKNAPSEAAQQNTGNNDSQGGDGSGLDKKDGLGENPSNNQKQDDSQPDNNQANKNAADNGSRNPNTSNNDGEDERPNNTGNGYGALNRNQNKPNQNQASDSTANARNTYNHYNRSNGQPGLSGLRASGGNKSNFGGLSSLGSGLKKGIKNFFNRSENEAESDKNGNSFAGDMFKKLMGSLMRNPYFWLVAAIILIFIIILFAVLGDGGGSGRGRKSCNYSLNGVSSTGTVELKDVKVELINCDGTAEDYTVIETVDFEKYILGVALAEAGVGQPDEALKAQMIAVRNFSLTRNQGMCPSNPDNCFYGYNVTTNKIRLRACTNDQVYFDYDHDTHYQSREGKPTLYGPEITEGNVWKKALTADEKEYYEKLANEVIGEVLLDESGNVLKLGYTATETDKFIELAKSGSTYKEILEEVYGSSSYSSATCSYNGAIDYFDYELSSEGHEILHERLDTFLEKQGTSLDEFNELIANNVEEVGYGTRAGVVAAAVTLIAELGNNYGVKIPYYWSGGHFDGVVVGALGYWGGTSTGSVKCLQYANGQTYSYCGFDCSGFVPWAIKNGGFNKGVDLASNFVNMSGARKVKLTNSPVMQPGDLLESSGHIILIVAVDEEAGKYICAEAMGNAYGVLFTRRSYTESGYYGVDLEDYYNNPANVREQVK